MSEDILTYLFLTSRFFQLGQSILIQRKGKVNKSIKVNWAENQFTNFNIRSSWSSKHTLFYARKIQTCNLHVGPDIPSH